MIYLLSIYLPQIFNESIEVVNFPNELRCRYHPSLYKKNRIIDLLVLYLLYPKYSNVVFMIKSMKTLAIHCLDIRLATQSHTALNIH